MRLCDTLECSIESCQVPLSVSVTPPCPCPMHHFPRRPDGSSGRVSMVVDALELNMGDDLVRPPPRGFSDPDEDEDMLSSVRDLG